MKKISLDKRIIVLGAYCTVIILLFGHALVPGAGELIWGDDIHRYHYFFRQFFLRSVGKGIVPFWNPFQFSGYPSLANPQSATVFYPMSWIFFFLPLNLAFTWYIALHILLAMGSMYWFMRRILDRPSAWVSGLVYGLSGYMVAQIWAGHVDIIVSASYLPLVIGLLWRLADGGSFRYIALAALAVAFQLLAGYQTIALFTWEAAGIVLVILVGAKRSIQPLFRVGAACLLGVSLSAVQLVPTTEFFRESVRTMSLPYSWTSYGAATLTSLATLVYPFVLGDKNHWIGPAPNYVEHAMYIGKIPLGLALVGVAGAFIRLFFRQKKHTGAKEQALCAAILTLIVLFGLWVSLASNAPVNLHKVLWDIVPMYKSIRFPTRHLVLVVFGLSALSGIGFSAFRSKRLLQWGIIVMCVGELLWHGRSFIEVRPLPAVRHDQSLISFLQQDQSLFRLHPYFLVWQSPRDSFDMNAAMAYGIFSTNGYDPSIIRDYYEFTDAAAGLPAQAGNNASSIEYYNVEIPPIPPGSAALDFLNVKYILVPTDHDVLAVDASGRFRLIREDKVRQYRLYENLNVLPRFFLVSRGVTLQNREAVAHAVRNGVYNLGAVVLFDGTTPSPPPQLSGCLTRDNSAVHIDSYTHNTIAISVDVACDSYLVSSEVYYPGWGAYLDNKKSDIYEGNLAFRTIFIPKGKHTIVYVYTPTIFYISAGVSFFTACVLLFWVRKYR